MRFNSITLGALLAFSASQVLGLAIDSELPSRSELKIEQRAGSRAGSPSRPATPPAPAEWYLKQVPGSGGQKYLTVDVLGVGYIEHTGNFKIHRYSPDTEAAQGKGVKALDASSRRIGTQTLTICSLAMLISEKGALMAHLNPEFCDFFLDPQRTAEQKKADAATAQYKASKKAFDAFQTKCQKYAKEFKKLAGDKFEAAIVRGPNQKDDKYGKMMSRQLFGVEATSFHYLEHDPHANEMSRVVLADFTGSKAKFSLAGVPVPINIPA